MPATAPGLCSGASGIRSRIWATTCVVDDDRVGEVRSAVHHPVTDGAQPDRGQVDARRGQLAAIGLHRRRVVGDPAARLADPLDGALGLHLAVSGTTSWYFSDDEPALSTSTGAAGRLRRPDLRP